MLTDDFRDVIHQPVGLTEPLRAGVANEVELAVPLAFEVVAAGLHGKEVAGSQPSDDASQPLVDVLGDADLNQRLPDVADVVHDGRAVRVGRLLDIQGQAQRCAHPLQMFKTQGDIGGNGERKTVTYKSNAFHDSIVSQQTVKSLKLATGRDPYQPVTDERRVT